MRRVNGLILVASIFAAAPALADYTDIEKDIDRRWPKLARDEYTDLLGRARREIESHQQDTGQFDFATTPEGKRYESRYTRCFEVWERMERALASVDSGVAYLTDGKNYSGGGQADSDFDGAVKVLERARTDWRAGTADSCAEGAQARWKHTVAGAPMELTIDIWIEKVKQLDGLAEARSAHPNQLPTTAQLTEMPRATVAAAGQIAAKWMDNPQYGCGTLPGWQKSVTRENPAGDPSLLPGCSKLDDDDASAPPSVKLLSRAKKIVMNVVEHDQGGDDSTDRVQMTNGAAELEQLLQDSTWKSAELDPMAASFERLLAWEKNELAAVPTRREIGQKISAFRTRWDDKAKKFLDHHYDVYLPVAEECMTLVESAKSAGVDLKITEVRISPPQHLTYQAAYELCSSAKLGMQKKAKAVAEAAAAEDAKWKTLCGGDKYKLWKAHGEHALTRGGWDQSRPEQACKADVWWSHHGPDQNAVYDCDKFTFSGNKQVGHVSKSNRFYQVCP